MQRAVFLTIVTGFVLLGFTRVAPAQQLRLDLNPNMIVNESDIGDPAGLVDEQRAIIGPPAGKPATGWQINSFNNKNYPFSIYFDLGGEKNLADIWFYDTNGKGDVVISSGEPGKWTEVATYDCGSYLAWASVKLDVRTRYLRLTRKDPQANFTEIALYEHSDDAWKALLAQKAEEARKEAERLAMEKKAREEALKRPMIDVEPYGKLSLIEEIDCAADTSQYQFSQMPENVSRVETILGRGARTIPHTKDTAAWFSYRIGKMKLLRPGGVYVLTVEYPEDAPRSMIVLNTGNETSRGFHTGMALGDAMHPKYVNNHNESTDTPLSGKYETWSLVVRLHDRYPQKGLVRGSATRDLTPADGFDVTIAQFSAKNIPMSKGAAVSRIRLFEVIDPDTLRQPLNLPPEGLPRRHLFWREEMADGVIGGKSTKPGEDGFNDPIDWYRNKAELMRFLGMNTYAKDLLEFGACQHWDPTEYGGNAWTYFDHTNKDLWGRIVELMGQYGHNVFPYYEYSGSKGSNGLGFQRRAKPLTRGDGNFTHISWIEKANADVTDPDTYEDFKKILDLTVIRHRSKANFIGAWLRPRSQLPVGFGDKTIERFVKEANDGKKITRQNLIDDKALYGRYLKWWELKRRDFFIAMRDHLRSNGIDDAMFLYTGCPGEPGEGFGTWDPVLVVDKPDAWKPIVEQPEHKTGSGATLELITPQQVAQRGLYLNGLTSPGINWGDWEVHHARPADDPLNYQDIEGVMLSHAFNRQFTVASPRTFDAYRTKTGLAMVRHYSLNENMMFGKDDKTILGYFVVDVEKAGPYCMMAEATAMANGDPTMIGYLAGNNFGRGFPQYVRNFNAAFLALPALPSTIVEGAAGDSDVVVRQIKTPNHGTWYALVNTSYNEKPSVTINLPPGATDAVTGEKLGGNGSYVTSFYPFQLRAWRVGG